MCVLVMMCVLVILCVMLCIIFFVCYSLHLLGEWGICVVCLSMTLCDDVCVC